MILYWFFTKKIGDLFILWKQYCEIKKWIICKIFDIKSMNKCVYLAMVQRNNIRWKLL